MSETRSVERSEQTLNRGIRSWHVSLIALGGIIGSCYFLELGMTFHDMGPGAVLLAYAIAGITIYGVMQSFMELLVNIPRRGSFVSYTREFMGDTASAGIGWAFWANWVCYIPSEALATAIFVNALVYGGEPPSVWYTFAWGIIALAILTLINVYQVKWFGHIESIMAIVKIFAIIIFIVAGILIWLGLIGQGGEFSGIDRSGNEMSASFEKGFIGADALLAGVGSTVSKLFPSGGFIIITLMIWTLVNFQGSEIVGLSAAETQNPEKNIPAACKKVAFRIIIIYLIPIFVLSLIMPYFAATLDSSVFAQALYTYGFGWGSKLFTIVTLIAAFSCANSGFYGTVRSLYGLSVEGLAPKFLSKLNRFNTPQNATLFTLAFIWVVFILSFVMTYFTADGGEGNVLYTALVGIAGFTGTLCWVGILYSHVRFRQRLKQRGYDAKAELGIKARWYPGLTWAAIIVQVAAMVLLIFEVGDGIPIFLLSLDVIVVPIAIYVIQKSRGKIRKNIVIGADEVTFDEKYPAKSGFEDKPEVSHARAIGAGNPNMLYCAMIVVVIAIVVISLIAINKFNMDAGIFDAAMKTTWILTIIEIILYGVMFVLTRAIGKIGHN